MFLIGLRSIFQVEKPVNFLQNRNVPSYAVVIGSVSLAGLELFSNWLPPFFIIFIVRFFYVFILSLRDLEKKINVAENRYGAG